jgi:hypothetical protein
MKKRVANAILFVLVLWAPAFISANYQLTNVHYKPRLMWVFLSVRSLLIREVLA